MPARHIAAFHVHQLAMLAMFASVSAEGQKTGEFTALKAENGSALCATSTADSKISVRSKIECYKNCVATACLCASGANYRKKEKRCEMYSVQPVDFRVVPDCTFYQVWPRPTELRPYVWPGV